jgi:hypothetical protein
MGDASESTCLLSTLMGDASESTCLLSTLMGDASESTCYQRNAYATWPEEVVSCVLPFSVL